MLEEKMKAIDFTLPDKDGNKISLHDFLGKKVVVYFYPKDDTPGCTKQACGFRNEYNKFKELNTIIIGISKDNSLSHAKFIAKYDLPFILLSDESHKVMEEYGVWQEKKLYGKTYMGVVRSSFLIDENGYIINKKLKVKPDTNALEIINLLEK